MPFVTGFAGRPRIPRECGYTTIANALGAFLFFSDTYGATSTTMTFSGGSRTGAVSNAYSAGYIMGGFTVNYDILSLIEKLRYYVDTKSSLGVTMASPGRSGAYSGSNNGVAGYVFAGYSNGSVLIDSEKLQFTTETKGSIGATLSNVRRIGGSMSNSGGALYMAGGVDAAYANSFSTVDKVNYSTDSRSTLGTGTSLALGDSTGFSNSGTAGYTGSGFVYSGGNGYGYRTMDKFAYSTDSRSTLSALMTGFPQVPAAFSNHQVAGYVLPNEGSSVGADKFLFSNDTKTTVAKAMGVTGNYVTSLSNSIGA